MFIDGSQHIHGAQRFAGEHIHGGCPAPGVHPFFFPGPGAAGERGVPGVAVLIKPPSGVTNVSVSHLSERSGRCLLVGVPCSNACMVLLLPCQCHAARLGGV